MQLTTAGRRVAEIAGHAVLLPPTPAQRPAGIPPAAYRKREDGAS